MNILVQRCDDSSAEYSVCGVLDFGDCIVSCHVFELAIMMAYSMCSKPEDPVQNVIPLLAGYLDAFPLPETDLDCLFWGVLKTGSETCSVEFRSIWSGTHKTVDLGYRESLSKQTVFDTRICNYCSHLRTWTIYHQ